jgi:hypothetical protein
MPTVANNTHLPSLQIQSYSLKKKSHAYNGIKQKEYAMFSPYYLGSVSSIPHKELPN